MSDHDDVFFGHSNSSQTLSVQRFILFQLNHFKCLFLSNNAHSEMLDCVVYV